MNLTLTPRFAVRVITAAGAIVALLAACSSGGGGSGESFDSAGSLVEVRFPDPGEQNPEAESEPPSNASLVQQVEWVFDARPNPAEVSSLRLPVRDDSGEFVEGTYEVDGMTVRFTPSLPTRPAAEYVEGANPLTYDSGGAGLRPTSQYRVSADPDDWDFIANIAAPLLVRHFDAADPKAIVMSFTTTADETVFFAGLPKVSPRLVSVDPADGATGVSPQLYTDPDGLFPDRQVYRLEFSAPVSPALTNVSDDTFALFDLDHTSGALALGIDVAVVENTTTGSVIEIQSSGILAFGHLLSLEYPAGLRGVSQRGVAGDERMVASSFRIADTGTDTVVDTLLEGFDDDLRRDGNPELDASGGFPLAAWNDDDSGILQASFEFQGTGELGPFLAPRPEDGETLTITLDTDSQPFPLSDGSTPGAPVITVLGGVFSFTDIVVPEGVIINVRGTKPLVLTATGSIDFNGQIDVSGRTGTPDNAYDSGTSSVPGGSAIAGGGRGGVSHPIIFWPPGVVGNLNMVSAIAAENGYGAGNADPSGGGGGLSGVGDSPAFGGEYMTDKEINCNELDDGNRNGTTKPPGGGGGSYLGLGEQPKNGVGNVRPDGTGSWIITEDRLFAGAAGASPFSDEDEDNDLIGPGGELTAIQGGQGGGGGGMCPEAYYCGGWCDRDEDPANDGVCDGPEVGGFSDSVVDARGGGGGGGAGAVMFQALGSIRLRPAARLLAIGGNGGGGEQIEASNYAGSGGGGSGGALIFQAGGGITMEAGAVVDVNGGDGAPACGCDGYIFRGCDGCRRRDDARGAGGDGGNGIIQFQVSAGMTAEIDGTVRPNRAWVDKNNSRNPIPFGATSIAVSDWFDMGRTIERPPVGSMPGFDFAGLDVDGFVITDAQGFVVDPRFIECDYLGQRNPNDTGYLPGEEPREDFIPENASIQVEFQAARSIAEGSKEVDPLTQTGWSGDPMAFAGYQFLRYRITFDIAADDSSLEVTSRRPVVSSIRVRTEF